MKIIHFCAGLEGWNGMANTARQFVEEETAAGHDSQLTNVVGVIERAEKVDRVHIHGTWLPVLWKVAKLAKKRGAELIVRPCGNYDPIRIRRGAIKRLKKWLVGPFEHAMLNRADFVQCTCAAEAEWVKAYHPKARIQMTDLKRFFDLGGGEGLGQRSRSTVEDSLHVLYLGRRHPLKGVEFLERAVREIGQEMDRRVLALRKIDEWLQGVDAESFDAALKRLVGERSSSNVYRFRKSGDRERAMVVARSFFCGFSRKIVELSDGRCVYFAPDARSKARNGGDLSCCWAEYAFHAVSSGGALLADRGYHERWYNLNKVINFEIIEKALLAEKCVPVLKNRPQEDSIKFFATSLQGGNFDVVVRLDEYGNAQANMTEVTFEVNQRKLKKLPRLVPLTEAVQTVVYHQTTAGSYPSDGDNITHSDGARKGTVREMGLGQRARSTMDVELRIVSDHFGEELERDWDWCDVLVLPTLSENFGRVVAEALERGKYVITTDGAPAWEGQRGVTYLKGYRDGTDEKRVELLREALGILTPNSRLTI